MRKIFTFIFFIFLNTLAFSQDQGFNNKITIGAYSNLAIDKPIRLTRKYITEDVGPFHFKESWSIGLNFSIMLSQKFRIEIATGYSVNKGGFELSPPIYAKSKIYSELIKTYNIPVTAYRYFKRDFFLSFGTVMDFEIPRKSYWINSQNGIGFSLGAGKEFKVRDYAVDLAPNLEMHSVLPFHSVKYQQRLLVIGLKFGFRFCFNNHSKENVTIAFNKTGI